MSTNQDIAAKKMLSKALSNPNLSQDSIKEKFEKIEKKEKDKEEIPKELLSLQDLIFLGLTSKEVIIGNFSFTLKTLNTQEQNEIIKNSLSFTENDRIVFFKKAFVAQSLHKINGKDLISFLDNGDDFESRLDLVSKLQSIVFEKLFDEFESLNKESKKIIGEDNIKK